MRGSLIRRRVGRPWVIRRFEEADEHFVPALLSEHDPFVRVRIGRVVRRVVERTGDEQPRTRGNVSRLLEVVAELPLEVVARHVQQRLLFTIGLQ